MRFGTLLVIGGLLLVACQPSEQRETPSSGNAAERTFRNVHGDATFVGDETCFTCHEEIYRGYQEHGMAKAYYPLTSENAVEDWNQAPLYHQRGDFFYRAFEENGRFFQEEYRLNNAGNQTHRLVRELRFVVGSGNAARTYLTEQNGRLYQLPLTWYTQGSIWGFSPGYEEGSSRFDRLVPERCMACHNGYSEAVPFAEGKYAQVPHGIGCERCHGPGSLHVDERLATPEPASEIDDTIVNPARLALDLRMDICQQCHLNGAVSILREGREAFDFRPSEPLAAHVAIFSKDQDASNAIDVISHVDRMELSACFTETLAQGQPMECITCHNPHEGFRDKGPSYFNNTCMTCHSVTSLEERLAASPAQDDHTANANCFSCHMPRVTAEDTPHATFTDHWIRVVNESPAVEPIVAHERVELKPHFNEDEGTSQGALYEGMAYIVYARQQGSQADMEKGIGLLEAALATDPEHGEAQYLLGFAHMQLGQAEAAIPALEASVRLDANIPERLNTLAQAYEAVGRDPVRIARLYRRALTIQSALTDIRINYGRFLEKQGQLDDAIAQYQQAIAEQPWLPTAHYNLGTAFLQKGDAEAAEASLREALALNPDEALALSNLGLLYATQGDSETARDYFERAVEVAPENASVLGNLGAYYLNTEQLDQAIAALERAVAADNQYIDGIANLALAHFRNDNMAAAQQYAQQALAINANHPLARQILDAL